MNTNPNKSSLEKRLFNLKKVAGAIRLIHVLPVVSITIIIGILAFFSLGGFQPNIAYFFVIMTAFFQEAFVGAQNDFVDREIDILYNKRKAIADGWINKKEAFYVVLILYLIFTGFSVGLGFYAEIGFWIILYLQGVNVLCMSYNLLLKNTPFSIIPYFIIFPQAPIYIWLSLGGFETKFLWYIPMIFFVAISGHIANELPDYESDKKYNNRNFSVIVGKKIALVILWGGSLCSYALVLAVLVIYNTYNWIIWLLLSVSIIIMIVSIIAHSKKDWKLNDLIFNLITAFLGLNILALIIALNF